MDAMRTPSPRRRPSPRICTAWPSSAAVSGSNGWAAEGVIPFGERGGWVTPVACAMFILKIRLLDRHAGLRQHLPAIHNDCLSGDESRFLACEKQRSIGDVFDRTEPARRDCGFHAGNVFAAQLLHSFGQNVPGKYGVHRDLEGCELNRRGA